MKGAGIPVQGRGGIPQVFTKRVELHREVRILL